jgi:exopolysaccharide production protein ExoQ
MIGMSRSFSRREASAPDPNRWTAPVIKAAVFFVTLFSNGNLHEAIIPDTDTSNIQQYVVIAMWIAIAGVSYFRRRALRIDQSAGLFMGLVTYALAIVSVIWSANPAASLPKAIALGIVIFGAYRLVAAMAMDEIVEWIVHGLFLLNALSIFLALFVPEIGLVKDYQHAGQWNGLFASKQTLGVCGALLLFFSSYRLIGPFPRLYYWAAAAAALACVIGSGSRGGGALAAAAVACLYLTSVSRNFARCLAFGPFVMSLIGGALIVYFVQTGSKYLVALDTEIDFTQRTFIWQHALSYFKDVPFLGFGLNAFWTLKDVKDLFIERNGWFLDNYHNGYIAVVMETGVIGLSAFVAGYFLYGLRISSELRRDGGLDSDVALTLVYTCLIFLVDFTETYFLRSTNIASTLLVISLFIGFARRSPIAAADRSEQPVPPTRPAREAHARRGRANVPVARQDWRSRN